MPPRTRPRRRIPQRNNQENNENQAALHGIDDSVPGLSVDPTFIPRTSTPARPLPRRERNPVQRTVAASPFPPSSPPFIPSPQQEITEPVVPASPVQDDPFGFFAAERRLKQRAQLQKKNKKAEEGNVGVASIDSAAKGDTEQSPISDGRPAFATPPPPATDSDIELELDLSTFVSGISGTRTPPGHTSIPLAASPRHRRPKRKDIPSSPSSELEEDEGGQSLLVPQTPSPMKRISTVTSAGPGSMRRPFVDISHLDNSPVKKSSTATTAAKTKGKKKGPAQKKYKTDETLAEEELKGMTEELRALLPSRPKRKAAQRKSGAPPQQTTMTKKAVLAEKKGKGKKSKPRSKKVNADAEKGEEIAEAREGESFVLSGGEREQFEMDREVRREYFRQVDEYVMDEESVYVI